MKFSVNQDTVFFANIGFINKSTGHCCMRSTAPKAFFQYNSPMLPTEEQVKQFLCIGEIDSNGDIEITVDIQSIPEAMSKDAHVYSDVGETIRELLNTTN